MAMQFVSSSSQYIDLGMPSELDLQPDEEWSVSLWINSTASGYRGIFGKGEPFFSQWAMEINFDNNFEVNVGGSPTNDFPSVLDGNLHHIVVVNENNSGTYRFNIYDNAVLDSGEWTNSGTSTTSQDVYIANQKYLGSDYSFDGYLYDTRVYNRLLSVNEVSTIYAARGNDHITHGLVGRWLMNEGPPGTTASGSGVIKDISGSKNNGTPSGSPTYRDEVLRFRRRMARI